MSNNRLTTPPRTIECGAAEWRVRVELAACYRLFVQFGWTDVIFTHLSARVPGQPNQYLINPYGLLFEEITASNLIKVNFDGEVIQGEGVDKNTQYNDAGHAIHAAVLRARDDVHAVLHSHTRAGMAVSAMQCGLLPLSQQANEIGALVCTHEYDYAPDNEAECKRLGDDLGDHWLMIMQNHGLLSVGRTIGEAFYFLYMLENACKVQVDVLASNVDTITPSPQSVAALVEYARPPLDAPADYVEMTWDALIRRLNARDCSYQK